MGEEILAAEAARNDYAIAWSARGNPAQLALLECPIFEVFFGGARGGGKTDGMLGEWIKHADRYGKDAIGLMLRRTRTELIETMFVPWTGARLHRSRLDGGRLCRTISRPMAACCRAVAWFAIGNGMA